MMPLEGRGFESLRLRHKKHRSSVRITVFFCSISIVGGKKSEKFSLDEDLDEDYDFTDEKAGAIHDTLKYSMDENNSEWLVNDDGKNNINDLIKETVALETTGKIGFYYLDKKRTQSIFKRSGYQLPSTLNNLSPNTIIRTIDDNVNKKSIILLKVNNLSDGSVIGKIALQKQVKR